MRAPTCRFSFVPSCTRTPTLALPHTGPAYQAPGHLRRHAHRRGRGAAPLVRQRAGAPLHAPLLRGQRPQSHQPAAAQPRGAGGPHVSGRGKRGWGGGCRGAKGGAWGAEGERGGGRRAGSRRQAAGGRRAAGPSGLSGMGVRSSAGTRGLGCGLGTCVPSRGQQFRQVKVRH